MLFTRQTGFLCIILFAASHAFAQSPQPAILEAGRAENPGLDYKPNANGVYPVPVRWQTPSENIVLGGSLIPASVSSGNSVSGESAAYHVYRSESPTAGYIRISAAPVVAERENAGFFIFYDENPDAVPGKRYYYRVLATDSPEEYLNASETSMGYGALSHEQYLLEYDRTIKSSHQKLTFMHKRAALSKLGKETKNGTCGGSIEYHARVAGLGARITIRYEGYADFYVEGDDSQPYFMLTGDCNTRASMSQSGNMDGTVLVSGMYPGKIVYDRIVIKKALATDGTYGVEPEGFPRREVSWKLPFLNNSIK